MDFPTRVFDADGHIIEPTDLYFGGLDPAFRNRVQIDTDLGEHHGRLFPLLDGQPSFGGSPWMRDYLRSDMGRQVLIDRFGPLARAGFDPPSMLRALDNLRGINFSKDKPDADAFLAYAKVLREAFAVRLATSSAPQVA